MHLCFSLATPFEYMLSVSLSNALLGICYKVYVPLLYCTKLVIWARVYPRTSGQGWMLEGGTLQVLAIFHRPIRASYNVNNKDKSHKPDSERSVLSDVASFGC